MGGPKKDLRKCKEMRQSNLARAPDIKGVKRALPATVIYGRERERAREREAMHAGLTARDSLRQSTKI